MSLSPKIRDWIDGQVEAAGLNSVREAYQELSARYRLGQTFRGFKTNLERLAYVAGRMPATAAVVSSVFQELGDFSPKSMLDIGSGPGTAVLVALEHWPELLNVRAIDRDEAMLKIASELSRLISPVPVKWETDDGKLPLRGAPADLVTISYVLGELVEKERMPVLNRLWDFAKQILIVIEPGTSDGFARVVRARKELLGLGAKILAPCSHQFDCPMYGIDWCHFPARVERSRTHRLLKSADMGIEDEKFSYLIVSRDGDCSTQWARIVEEPKWSKNRITLRVCEAGGSLRSTEVTATQKGYFRETKKLGWGDRLRVPG